MPKPLSLRTLVGGAVVDREAGVIRRVPVITAGTTKPSGGGHGPFDVDAISLQQVADAINSSAKVGSRITHPEVEGVDGISCRVGHFKEATVEGNKVFANFYFGTYATEDKKTLLCGLVEEWPEEIGVSIFSETARIESSPGTTTGLVLRLDRLENIDWTDDPAANPAGMLSAAKKGTTVFNQAQLDHLYGLGLDAEANAEAIVAFVEGLDEEQKAALEALATVEPQAEPEGEPEPVVATEDEDEPVGMAEGEEEEETPKAVAASAAKKASLSLAAAKKAERDRIKEIRSIALQCKYDDKWANTHIDNETPINEVRRIALASLKKGPDDMPTTQVKVGADLNRDNLNQAVQDAIMLRANTRNFVKFDDAGGVMLSADNRPVTRTPEDRAANFRGHSIIEMGRRYLLALGYDQADRMQKPQLATLLMSRQKLQAALGGVFLANSTGDFPFLLADSMGKVLRGEYALAPHTWDKWCRKVTAPDFKDIKAIQLSEAADLAVIPEGDEYTYASLTEGRETYALETQGKGIKFTRQMLINDDLSAFDRVPRLMGRAAARAVETAAIAILTANAQLADSVALFATAHGNLTTGVLSVASLGTARAKMRRQTALGSTDPLELTPRYLLVPETIATTAMQLVSSTVDPALNNATPNPFANQVEVIPSARLDLDSTAEWYLLADPSEIDTVEMAFLEGEETPVVEEEDEFDTDVRKIKVRHTFKPKAIDYRGMVRSSGS